MKFVSEILILKKMKEALSLQKGLHGPPEGCGPPVEKHWSRLANLM